MDRRGQDRSALFTWLVWRFYCSYSLNSFLLPGYYNPVYFPFIFDLTSEALLSLNMFWHLKGNQMSLYGLANFLSDIFFPKLCSFLKMHSVDQLQLIGLCL